MKIVAAFGGFVERTYDCALNASSPFGGFHIARRVMPWEISEDIRNGCVTCRYCGQRMFVDARARASFTGRFIITEEVL